MPEDAELLRSYANNQSESAFSELVSRHLNLVYSGALRRTGGDSHRASDITQQVFISLASHAGPLSGHASLVGWLYTCTRNAVRADARAEKRRRIREQEAHAMQSLETSFPEEPDFARLRAALDEVIDELSGRDREAILLRFFKESSYREIGTKLLVTEDAARMRVERSLDKLRTLLARRGVASTAAALAVALTNQAVVAAPTGLAESITGTILAGTAVGSLNTSNVLGILKIMSTTKASIGILSAICVLAVGSSIFETHQARQADLSLAAANEASLDRIQNIQARLTAAEKARAAAEQALQASKASGKPAAQVPVGQRSSSTLNLDDMRKDPSFAALWRKQQLRTIQLRYGYALTTMKLSPEDLARLKNLLVDRIQARMDAAEVGQEAGLTGTELNSAERQAEGTVTDEIKSLVGNDGYAQLQASQMANQYEPLIASSVGVDLNALGIPLTPDQVSSLAQSFSDHETKFGPGAGRQVPDAQTGLTPYFQSLVDRISPTVSPAQLQVLKDYFVELEQESQFYKKQAMLNSGRSEAPGRIRRDP